jgi:transcriptional regulator with XRE-family HTH domain
MPTGITVADVANHELTRTTLGRFFNEGARLLWLALEARGWSQADLRRALGVPPGAHSRWLYGDRRPGRQMAQRIYTAVGIPVTAWDEAPTCPFELPAARRAA